MSYIGNQPTIGQYRKLDDISGSFNGSLTAFTMQVGSTNVSAGSVFQLLISLGGVIQEPGTDFTVSGSTITFTTAPAASLSFFGIMMGQPLNTATPGDSTVTGAKIVDGTITGGKLAAAFNYDSGLLFLDDTNNRVGVGTTSPESPLHVDFASGSPQLTIERSGTSTGKYSIGTVSNELRITDEAQSERRLTVDSSGHLGVGTTSPSGRLDVRRDVNGDNPIFFRNMDTTSSSSAMTTTLNFNFNRTSGGLDLAAAQIRAGKEQEWVGAAANQDGYLAFFTTGNETSSERMRINSGGRLMIGSTSTTSGSQPVLLQVGGGADYFHVERSSSNNVVEVRTEVSITSSRNQYVFKNPNGTVGSITTNGSGTSFNETSDYRLKENVVAVTDGITRLKQLKPSRYNFIADPTKTVDGFIAHEVQDVVPDAVTGEKDAVDSEGRIEAQAIDKSKLVPLLTAALQEAIGKIEALETANASLEARLTALEGGTP